AGRRPAHANSHRARRGVCTLAGSRRIMSDDRDDDGKGDDGDILERLRARRDDQDWKRNEHMWRRFVAEQARWEARRAMHRERWKRRHRRWRELHEEREMWMRMRKDKRA